MVGPVVVEQALHLAVGPQTGFEAQGVGGGVEEGRLGVDGAFLVVVGAAAVHADVACERADGAEAVSVVFVDMVVVDDSPRVVAALHARLQHAGHALATAVEAAHGTWVGDELSEVLDIPVDVAPAVGPGGPAPRAGAVDEVEVVLGGIFGGQLDVDVHAADGPDVLAVFVDVECAVHVGEELGDGFDVVLDHDDAWVGAEHLGDAVHHVAEAAFVLLGEMELHAGEAFDMAHHLAGLLDAAEGLVGGTGFGAIGEDVEGALGGALVALQGLQCATCMFGSVIDKKCYRCVHGTNYIFIQPEGMISVMSPLAVHCLGATTTFPALGFSQAPHQLKVLLAMMLWLHRLIRYMSCQLSPP